MSQTPRSVLVTGAARRLGRVIALAFAQQGWDVAVHYRASASEAQATAREITALGRRCVLVRGDLDAEGGAQQVFAQAAAELGGIDALVNNASTFDYDNAHTVTQASMRAHLCPNLCAPVLLIQALHRHLCARGAQARGVAVNLLDQKLFNLNPDFFSYTLAKAALHAATTMLAQALAPTLRVVGVAPGLTLPSYLQNDQAFARTHALAPLGQGSSPEDIAQAVLFAAHSRSITGTTLVVDGGQHLLGLPRDFSMMAQGDATPERGPACTPGSGP